MESKQNIVKTISPASVFRVLSIDSDKTAVVLGNVLYLSFLVMVIVSVLVNALPSLPAWATIWLAATVGMIFAPRWPIIGPLIYVLVTYSVPRYKPASQLLNTLSLPEWIAYAALGALAISHFSGKHPFKVGGRLGWIMIALWSFLGISALHAIWNGFPWDPSESNPMLKDPLGQWNQVIILFFLGANLLPTRSGVVAFGVTLFLTLAVRVVLGGIGNVQGDHDIAFLIATTLPFFLFTSLRDNSSWLMNAATVASVIPPLIVLSLTRNRAGLVGLVAAMIVAWLRARRKLATVVVVMLVAITVFVMIPPESYLRRFATVGSDLSSQGRINVWRSAINMVRQNPFWGIGLGNFGSQSLKYGENPIFGELAAHNSFLHIAAEGGIPALLLYVALIFGTYVCSAKLCRISPSWLRTAGRMIEASTTSYVVAGQFISRHNFAMAYLIMGLAAGLWNQYRRKDN